MIDSKTAKKICDAVDHRFDEQLHVTQELVTYPSQRGQEHTAQAFMYDALSERGLAMDRWAIDIDEIRTHPGFSPATVDYTNAVNVVGTHRPSVTKGHSLILSLNSGTVY